MRESCVMQKPEEMAIAKQWQSKHVMTSLNNNDMILPVLVHAETIQGAQVRQVT